MTEHRQTLPRLSREEPWSRFQELAADVRDRMENHRIGAESARVAYYVFLSLFPFLLAIFALTGYLGREALFNWIMQELMAALPPQAALALEDSVRQFTQKDIVSNTMKLLCITPSSVKMSKTACDCA